MFTINEDLSIYATRGDIVFFGVSADNNGESYKFQAGDVVRIKIFGKKDCENVVLQKDFPVIAATEKAEIYLTEEDTKIGEVISKPRDYWYEIELNPFTNPQTIIGYDDDGAKVFRLFPEGEDVEWEGPDEEDIPVLDEDLDLTSHRPVENQAVARRIIRLESDLNDTNDKLSKIDDYPVEQGTAATWRYCKWASGKVEAWIRDTSGTEIGGNTITAIEWEVPDGIFSKTPEFILPWFATGSSNASMGMCTIAADVSKNTKTNIAVNVYNASEYTFRPRINVYVVQF